MCGIAGLLSPSSVTSLRPAAELMAATLAHRGPDDGGAWEDPSGAVALGHRRLSIVDLSPAGHQPMSSPSGRYVLTYNGEVYNHRELREALQLSGQAPPWHGHSDTEVLLAAIEAWGVRRTLERTVGMFAFALWDRDGRTLTLVRDRLGIKPLYYGTAEDGAFLFGSELKALCAYPQFRPAIDPAGAALLLRFGSIPSPLTIYGGVRKVAPGTLVEVSAHEGAVRIGEAQSWWSAREVFGAGCRAPFEGSVDAAVDELDWLVRDAVSCRLVADVPVGALLSGGIDSSLVVATAQATASEPVRTFTIGSDDRRLDETEAAAAVASHLGTRHTVLRVAPADALDLIPGLPQTYDEPFADLSQIPTMLVSRLARGEVTVALSGDGGDELFGGYARHIWAGRLASAGRWAPAPLRGLTASALRLPTPGAWDHVSSITDPLLPRSWRQGAIGLRVEKFAASLATSDPSLLREQAVALWARGRVPVRGYEGAADRWPSWDNVSGPPAPGTFDASAISDATTRMLYEDTVTYLPDDVLTKVDRASMAYALEVRVPLLDHRVVEFAARLPIDWKVRGGLMGTQGKWLLRRLLRRYLPDELIDRPKMGFGVPVDEWLRGPLRPWAEELLEPSRLAAGGLLDPAPIRQRWDEHLSGRRNWVQSLWAVLMLQSWRQVTPGAVLMGGPR